MKLSDILKNQPLTAFHMHKRRKNNPRKSKTKSLTWDPFGGMSGYSGGYKGRQMHGTTGHDS